MNPGFCVWGQTPQYAGYDEITASACGLAARTS
jgi:hypothetical protein